jgi:hypothetical protein
VAANQFPESITQQTLASRPKPASSSHGLLLPTAHGRNEGPLAAGCSPARYVPPSGFGYPLDGFLPSIPGRFCFTPAALMGFTLRSFLLPEGIPTFPPRRTHLPFHLSVYPGEPGPARQAAAPGLWPFRESLTIGLRLSTPTAGCSLGLASAPSTFAAEAAELNEAPAYDGFSHLPASQPFSRTSARAMCSPCAAAHITVRHTRS